jgi:hypothetical protein
VLFRKPYGAIRQMRGRILSARQARAFSGEVEPVRLKKTRQNKKLEPVPIQSEPKWL